jgi:GNAT superfamily N-acetyltransferase
MDRNSVAGEHVERSDMQIRGATLEDSAGIAKVQVDSYRSAYAGIFRAEYLEAFTCEEQEQDWRNWMSEHPDDVLYVAESEKGGLLAYALARPGETGIDGYDSELIALHVREKSQRMGIGRLMLWTVAKELRRAKCHSLMLWTFEENPSCAFYDHLGATRLDERKESEGNPAEIVFGWPRIEQVWNREMGV